MGKKKMNYRCTSCGFECEKETQLVEHCDKHHKDQPMLLYTMIGKFASIEHATIAFQMADMDKRNYSIQMERMTKDMKKLQDEKQELVKAHNIYTTAANSIMNTMHLLGDALAPIRGTDRHGS